MCDELTEGINNNLTRMESLVLCKVLPPQNLYIPVLPVKKQFIMHIHGDFMMIMKKTIESKNKKKSIISSLNSTFKKVLPDIVVKKLADYFNVKDLL